MINSSQSPVQLFKSHLTKGHLTEIFQLYIDERASVGRDGTRVERFKENIDVELDVVIRKIKTETYTFTGYKEKLISKGAQSCPRQISIPTVRDKLVLKFLSELLAKIYPEHVSKPPHQLVKQIHAKSAIASNSELYLRLDIQDFYPTINHSILLRILRRKIRHRCFLSLLENALETPTGKPNNNKNKSTIGVQQGLSISNILSSIYLHDLDQQLQENRHVAYWRFVDDILIVGQQKEIEFLAKEVPKIIRKKRKLVCHKVGENNGKSAIIPITQGVDYLGYHFRQKEIQIRISSVKKMYTNLMNIVTSMKYKGNKAPLIWRLNLRLTGCKYKQRRIGWLFFFSQTENRQQIMQLDAFLKKQLSSVLLPDQQQRVKTLVRAYHEIKFNFQDTKYVPDFDNFDDEQMKAQIKILMPFKKGEDLDVLTTKELSKLFNKCITREITNLERDMLEIFS